MEKNEVLKGINLTVNDGENLVILGRSGSGKSVTIKCLVGLVQADKGKIQIFEDEITTLNNDDLNEIRLNIGFMFQNGALYDSMVGKAKFEIYIKTSHSKFRGIRHRK